MLQTNNGSAKLEQPITTENLSIFRMPTRTKIIHCFMNVRNRLFSLVLCLGIIILMFTITSLLDIAIAIIYPRFYSTAAFVVTFGVGGVFAGIFSYSKAVGYALVKNEFTRWSVLILIWVTATLFIYPLSVLEGGEYKAAFIAYGITLAFTTLLFVKGKIEF